MAGSIRLAGPAVVLVGEDSRIPGAPTSFPSAGCAARPWALMCNACGPPSAERPFKGLLVAVMVEEPPIFPHNNLCETSLFSRI